MNAALVFSSVTSGILATAVMLIVLYLPLLWGGRYYDTLGALGSTLTRQVDERSRLLGMLLLFAGGILFAFFYGAFVLMLDFGPFPPPDYVVVERPLEINLFYPLVGLVAGLGQGIFVSLILTFFVTDFHPVPSYRNTVELVRSFIVGHLAYGLTVMFFQHQLLQFFR